MGRSQSGMQALSACAGRCKQGCQAGEHPSSQQRAAFDQAVRFWLLKGARLAPQLAHILAMELPGLSASVYAALPLQQQPARMSQKSLAVCTVPCNSCLSQDSHSLGINGVQDEKFQSAPGSKVGTPAYLAPEVISTTRGRTYNGKVSHHGLPTLHSAAQSLRAELQDRGMPDDICALCAW